MMEVLIAVVYCLACMGLGMTCLHFAFRRANWSLYDFVIGLGVGMALLGACLIFVGLAGVLVSEVIWGMILMLNVLTAWHLSRWRPAFPVLSKSMVSYETAVSVVLIAASLFLLGWTGVLAYFRPAFGDADAFYMNYARLIAASGRLEAMPFLYRDFSAIGLMGEMHYAAILTIASPVVAKVLAWLAGVNLLAILLVVTVSLGGRLFASALACVVFVTSDTVTDYLSDGKTDLFPVVTALTIIAILVSKDFDGHRRSIFLLVGILSGISAYAKFSFLLCLAPAVLALVLMSTWQKNVPFDRWKTVVQATIWSAIGVFVGLLPHLLKNYIIFGNALAPFFGMDSNWADQTGWYASDDLAWIIATYPFALTFGQYSLMGGTMSPVWLALVPMVYFAWVQRGALPSLLFPVTFAALLGLVFWVALRPSILVPRYFLPNLLLIIPVCAIGAQCYIRSKFRNNIVFASLVALSLSAPYLLIFVPPAGVWSAVPENISYYRSQGSPKCGLSISDFCRIFNLMNDEMQDEDRVFVLGYYTIDLDVRHFQNINTIEESNAFKEELDNIWSWLNENGFRYVFVQAGSHGHLVEPILAAPVPENLMIEQRFEGTQMTVFTIEKTQ